jgi:hypothetical protein
VSGAVSGEVLAEVQRVLRGDSERALVHAVDDDGLEYRIELPERAVREVEDGRGYTLRLSWSLEANTSVAEAEPSSPGELSEISPPTEQATARPERRTPSEVDAAFMALMKGLEGRPAEAPTGSASSSSSSPSIPGASASEPARGIPDSAMQLASRLGLAPPESATTPQTIE